MDGVRPCGLVYSKTSESSFNWVKILSNVSARRLQWKVGWACLIIKKTVAASSLGTLTVLLEGIVAKIGKLEGFTFDLIWAMLYFHVFSRCFQAS